MIRQESSCNACKKVTVRRYTGTVDQLPLPPEHDNRGPPGTFSKGTCRSHERDPVRVILFAFMNWIHLEGTHRFLGCLFITFRGPYTRPSAPCGLRETFTPLYVCYHDVRIEWLRRISAQTVNVSAGIDSIYVQKSSGGQLMTFVFPVLNRSGSSNIWSQYTEMRFLTSSKHWDPFIRNNCDDSWFLFIELL